jgi:tight adherence protein C
VNAAWPLAAAVAAGALAWHGMPRQAVWPSRRAARDRRRGAADLPAFLELLSLCLSSGLSLLSAWSTAAGETPEGWLRNEVQRALRFLELGRPAPEALSALAQRMGDERVAMALALIAQALARGNAIESLLLNQAASLRRLRMIEAERRAQTAPLRMMLPMFLLIFPAVLLLLLAPVCLRLAQGGRLF